MKKILFLVSLLLGLALPMRAEDGFDPGSLIIGHVTDAHSWHLFDYTSKDSAEHSVAVNLPVILVQDGHVELFSSGRFHHGGEVYRGKRHTYALVGGGTTMEEIICVTGPVASAEVPEDAFVDHHGNVFVRELDAEGNALKPVDLSLTKTSSAIVIASILLLVIVFVAKRGYKKRPNQAPHGLQSLVEYLVVFVRDDIAIPMIGEKHYRRYLPYLLTLFFFIFFCNIMGLIPIFPAGANITGNIAVTAILAVITFLITNISGNRHYWTDIFNTPGVPAWLKVFPLMPVVELVGVFTKPIVLMIRLFANMTAGHVVVLGFIVMIFIFSSLFGAVVGGAVSVVSVVFAVFIDLLECLVAYIQAFVFTMLTAIYIGMAVEEPHTAEA